MATYLKPINFEPEFEDSADQEKVNSQGGTYLKPINYEPDFEEEKGDFIPGIKRGIDQTQASLYGATALVGSAVGSESVKQWGMEGYKRNMEEAKENPAKNSFKDVYTGKAGIGGSIDWAQGMFGELIPSMAEAAIGTAIGTLAAPGPGSVVGGFATRTVLKKSIEALTKEAVEAQISKGIITEASKGLVESELKKQITKQALLKFGGKVGMGAAVLPLESGGNYAQLLDEKGIDAPGTSLLFGALSTALEYAGGNSKLVDKFIDGVGSGNGRFIKDAAKELLTNIPEEALQEGGQEVFSILNTVVNTDEKLLTGKNLDQIIESMGGGAIGGLGGAGLSIGMDALHKDKPTNLLDKTKGFSGEDIAGAPETAMGGFQAGMKTSPTDQSSDTIPVAGVPNEEELGWIEEINRQRNPPPPPPSPPPNLVQNRYAENQQAMAGIESVPDPSITKSGMTESKDLLAKNIDTLKQVQSRERSVTALENRQQAMGQPGMYEFQQGLETQPEEPTGKYLPFAGLGDMVAKNEYPQAINPVKAPIPVNMEPGTPEYIDPQARQPQTNRVPVNMAMGEQVPATHTMPDGTVMAGAEHIQPEDTAMQGFTPVFEHEVEPEKINTNPTEAQKEAGNYQKDHIKIDGLNITIENPDGSTRKGTDKSGKQWESTMSGHYGYFKRTEGKDGDQVDVIVKPGTETSPKVFVVDQIDPKTGRFDEHKTMMGYSSKEEARDGYLSNYEKGWLGLGEITEMDQPTFKEWLRDGKRTKKPLAVSPQNSIPVATSSADLSPGQAVTWKNKKGEELKGELLIKSKNMWQVKKPDGKKTFVLNKDLSLNVPENVPVEIPKKEMSFEEFEKEYLSAFQEMSKYGADQVGAEHFAEKMAELSDAYPDWAEKVENSKSEPKPQSSKDDQAIKQFVDSFLESEMAAGKKLGYAEATPEQIDKFRTNQYNAKRFAEADAAEDKDRAENPDKYISKEQEDHLFGKKDKSEVLPKTETSPQKKELTGIEKQLANTSEADLDAMLDDVFGPAEMVKKVGIETLKGVNEAIKGLGALFTPKNTLSSGIMFNAETYAAAKPHFEKAWAHAKAAKFTLEELIKHIASQFEGVSIRPYLKQFLMDQSKPVEKESGNDYNEGKDKEVPNATSDLGTTEKNESGPTSDREPEPGTGVGRSPDMADGQRARTDKDTVHIEPGATGTKSSENDTKSISPKSDNEKRGEAGPGSDSGSDIQSDDSSTGRTGDNVRGNKSDGRKSKANDSGVESKSSPEKLKEEDQNNVIQKDDVLFLNGAESKIQANIKAIRLLKKLESENRNPTKAEKKTLSQYVGWGAFSQKIFNQEFVYAIRNPYRLYGSDKDNFETWKEKYGSKLHPDLNGLMTKEEWASAMASTLNAHYTSKEVIQSVWTLIDRLGFKGGNILEPSAGVGHFFGLMPEKLSGKSVLHGIELDSLSGRILQKLYPQAHVQIKGFEEAKGLSNNSLDLVVSNFPFGAYQVMDKNYPQYSKWSIHNYFFGKSIDLAKPGGLVVGITSHYTLDAVSNGAIRKDLSEKADLIGAIRLPATAFKKDAGTEVVTDILVFRKKDGTEQLGSRFRLSNDLTIGKGTASVNEYFTENPEMVLGENSLSGSMYGKDEYTVTPKPGNLEDQINTAIEKFPENIAGETQTTKRQEDIYADDRMREGVLTQKGSKFYVVENGKLVQPTIVNSSGKAVNAIDSKTKEDRTAAYLGLRDGTKSLIMRMLDASETDSDLTAARGNLNKLYDKFVKGYGNINSVGNSFLRQIDNDFPILDALEIESEEILPNDKKVKVYSKADILKKRTIFPFIEPESAESVNDAVSISLVYKNKIDTNYIAKLLGMDEQEVRADILEKEHAYVNPDNGLLEPPDKYLSGNVKKKLAIAEKQAESDPLFKKNVEALKAVQPEDLDIDFIYFKLGSSWIPDKAVKDFVSHLTGIEVNVTQIRTSDSSSWVVDNRYRHSNTALNTDTWGVEGAEAVSLIKDSLNLKRAKVYEYIHDYESGKNKPVENKEKSLVAQKKQDEIQNEFRAWARSHKEWAPQMAEIYNREYSGFRARVFAVPDIDRFPGANPEITLRPLQKKAILRCLQESTLLSYGVGTGKTFTFVTLSMEMRRLQTARKPMIVVQGSTISQYRNAFKKLYPQSKVLIPDDTQRSAKNRKKLLSQVATGDWDAVVIPHSFFDGIADDPVREAALIQEQIGELTDAMINASDQTTVKQMEKTKKKKTAKLLSLMDRRTDDTLTFEEMGVDALLIDEAHAYKRSEFSTKMGNIKGIDSGASQRSSSLILKSNFIREKTNNKNIILATGTPISNTTAEVWAMVRYVKPELLEEYGVSLFDDFAANFGDTSITTEETDTGDFKEVERFNKFTNGPELMALFQMASDVVLTKNAGLNLPKVVGGKAQSIVIERSNELGGYIEELRAMRKAFEEMTGREKMQNRHIPLVIFGRAKKAAIDLQLINPAEYSDDPNSKLNQASNNIFKVWSESLLKKSTQVVFLDSYQDSTKTFNAYTAIKNKLVKLGIPEKEILILSEANNDSQKEAMFQKIRTGDSRIIIGSTSKLGVGVNIQDKLIAAHHIDVPMRPMDIEQRNGRIVREGNENSEVQIYNYGVKNTLDSVMYDRLVKKQKFIDQMLNGEIEGREFDDPLGEEQISFAEMNAAFAGNPLLFEKSDLAIKIKELEILHNAFVRNVSSAKREINSIERRIPLLEKEIIELDNNAEFAKKTFPENEPFKFEYSGEEISQKDFIKNINTLFDESRDAIAKRYDGKTKDAVIATFLKEEDRKVIEAKINGLQVKIEILPSPSVRNIMNYDEKKKFNLDKFKHWSGSLLDVTTSIIKPSKQLFYSFDGTQFTKALNDGLEKVKTKFPAATKQELSEVLKNKADLEKVAAKQFEHTEAIAEKKRRMVEINKELEALSGVQHPTPDDNGQPIPDTKERTGFYRMSNDVPVLIGNGKKFEIKGYESSEFFIGQDDDGFYNIYEKSTGLRLSSNQKKGRAESMAMDNLARVYPDPQKFKEFLAGQPQIDDALGSDAKFSTESDSTPGQGVTLKDIQNRFKGQDVFLSPDGSISIRLKNGLGLTIKSVQSFDGEDINLAIQSGRMTENGVILGKHQSNEITLNRDLATNFTRDHELYHFLKANGLISKSDGFVLIGAMKGMSDLGFKISKDVEENEANTFAKLLIDREKYRGTAIGRIIQKVADFIEGLLHIGRQSSRKIARSVESGKIFSRDSESSDTGNDTGNISFQTSPDIIDEKFGSEPSIKETLTDLVEKAKSPEQRSLALDRLTTKTLDRLHPIKRLGSEAYKLHRMLTGIKTATFSMFLEHGPLSWVGNTLTVKDRNKGVIPFLKSIGPDWKNLLYWVAAKRAEQLELEGRENWLDKDARDKIFAKVGTHSKNGETWQSLNLRFQTINKNVLDIAEQAGLIDPEARGMWESNFYIPFYRIFEDETTKQEFLSGPHRSKQHISAQIKKLKGGEAKIGDLVENVLTNWMSLIDASVRNKARASAFEAGQQIGILEEVEKKDLVKVLGSETIKRYAVVKEGLSKARDIFDTQEEAEAWAYDLEDQGKGKHNIEPRTTYKVVFGSMKDRGILSFQRNGEPIYFKTDDMDLFEALSEIDTKAFNNVFMRMMGGAKRMLSFGATFGPAFRIRNMIRDTVHTSVVQGSFIPFLDTARGFLKSMTEDQDYIEYMASGFGFGSSYVHSDDPKAGARFLKNIIRTEGHGALRRILDPARPWDNILLRLWEKIGSSSENAARLGLYTNLKKKGMSNFEAGFEGRDLMDFSMHGSSQTVQILTRIIPFLNARFQALYKLGRASRENPKAFLLKSAILTTASLMLWSLFKDDDRYKQLEDWDKWTYFHFWIGNEHYRIPKPFEIGALFCSLPESIANVQNGTEEGKFVWDWFKFTAGSVFNIDMPQLIKPVVEGQFNMNTFKGNKIVPDSIAKLKPSEQYQPWTSDTMRMVGEALNISPLKLQHYVNGYFSTIGSMVLFGTDIVSRKAMGYPERPEGGRTPFDIGISESGDPRSTKYNTRFYKLYEEMESANQTFTHLLKTGQKEKAKEFLTENKDIMRLKEPVANIRSVLALVNEQSKKVQNSKTLTPEEKKEKLGDLNKKKNEITKRLFETIRKSE